MTLRAWFTRLRGSLRPRDALEREMQREMEIHLEMATQRNRERGLSPEAAAREARLRFGSTEAFKEEAREALRVRVAENVLSDARFAIRSLRRSVFSRPSHRRPDAPFPGT